ncbi:Rhodanese-like domain-containing protein, partial [Gaertneriomyces semiglobifer]
LIDVREPHETAEGTIPTAQKIPVGSLHEALDLPSDKFQATYGFEKPKRSDHIIFYCRSGKRSGLAHAIAKQMGYQETRNYSGSWLEWSANS